MRRIYALSAVIAVAWFWAVGAVAQSDTEIADAERATRQVIEQQLEAFQRNALEDAYRFAAPSIQRMFPTPDAFGEMVRNGYPMVWRPSAVDYIGGAPIRGGFEQRLALTDAAGALYAARYVLKQVDGGWRIAAVFIERLQAPGV